MSNGIENKLTMNINKINALLKELEYINRKAGLDNMGNPLPTTEDKATTINVKPEPQREPASVFPLLSIPKFREQVNRSIAKKLNEQIIEKMKEEKDKKK